MKFAQVRSFRITAVIVLLTLMSGCAQTVPDLSGLTRSEIVEELAGLGLTAEFAEDYSDAIPSGEVIRSKPSAGERAEPGMEVQVTLSKGIKPDIDSLGVPEVEIWWDSSFFPLSLEVAGRFTTETYSDNPCGYTACDYWVMEITSKNGCPGGLFIQLNILDGSVVVDSAIDSVSSLRAGQIAELVFTKRDLGSGTFSAQVSSASCY